MKQTYKFLTKNLPYVLLGAVLTTILGVIACILGYDKKTSWLRLGGACTIVFALLGLATICFAGYIAYKTKDVHIKKIRKNSGFLKVGAYLAFAITLFIFGFELVKLIMASYNSMLSEYFSIWRVFRFIFALPCACHFLFVALPTRIKRKRVKIPKVIRYITSVSAVLWSIFGLLSSYFSNQLSTMNILKIWQVVLYLCFTVFFLFEAKFEHISQAPRAYIFMGCTTFTLTMAFTLTTIICVITRIIPYTNSFSAAELICTLVIGIYAFARICAIVDTLRHVIMNSDSGTFSSKFGHQHQHRHHHHHHSSSSKSVNEATEKQASENNTDKTEQNN